MTSTEIIDSVRRKILETGTEVISDATLLLYINLAYQDVYKQLFPNASIIDATITCTAGVCVLPSDFGTMYGGAYDTADNEYEEVPIMDFDREDFSRAVTLEEGTLKVYPRTITSLVIKYYPQPVTLTAIINPTINSYFHEPIVYGAVYRAHEDLQDETLTQFYQARFKQEMQDRLSVQSGYEENNQRGSTMFTEQSLIGNPPYASF